MLRHRCMLHTPHAPFCWHRAGDAARSRNARAAASRPDATHTVHAVSYQQVACTHARAGRARARPPAHTHMHTAKARVPARPPAHSAAARERAHPMAPPCARSCSRAHTPTRSAPHAQGTRAPAHRRHTAVRARALPPGPPSACPCAHTRSGTPHAQGTRAPTYTVGRRHTVRVRAFLPSPPSAIPKELERLCVSSIRFLAIDGAHACVGTSTRGTRACIHALRGTHAGPHVAPAAALSCTSSCALPPCSIQCVSSPLCILAPRAARTPPHAAVNRAKSGHACPPAHSIAPVHVRPYSYAAHWLPPLVAAPCSREQIQVRAPGHAHGLRSTGLCAVGPGHAVQPTQPQLAEQGPVRAVRRPRVHVSVCILLVLV